MQSPRNKKRGKIGDVHNKVWCFGPPFGLSDPSLGEKFPGNEIVLLAFGLSAPDGDDKPLNGDR